jgi:hypothetical protein
MPNEVFNKLRVIKGDPKEVFEFIRTQESILDFNNIVPMPPNVCARVAAQEAAAPCFTLSDGSKVQGIPYPPYRDQWNRENWGTKWNAMFPAYSEKNPDRLIQFVTAWDPPVPVFSALAKRFPRHKLVIHSREPNMGINLTFTLQRSRLECKDRQPESGYVKSRGRGFTKTSGGSLTERLVAQELKDSQNRIYSPFESGVGHAVDLKRPTGKRVRPRRKRALRG